jgi:hypothetical protein
LTAVLGERYVLAVMFGEKFRFIRLGKIPMPT